MSYGVDHVKKLSTLVMVMKNWKYNNGNLPMDSPKARTHEENLHKVNELVDNITRLGLTQEEMLEMNILYKKYGDETGYPGEGDSE